MLPIPGLLPLLANIVIAYLVWWVVSRLGLLGAWIYSKPGDIRLKQWVIIFLSLCPLCMEMLSSMLVIFALALGWPTRTNYGYPEEHKI